MDVSTGAMLLTIPEFALGLMGISGVQSESLIFVRFIGAFVFGVGSLYWLASWPVVKEGDWRAVRYCFLSTAWIRGVVFIFGTIAILMGALAWEWGTVPLADGALAAFQLWVVGKGKVPGNV